MSLIVKRRNFYLWIFIIPVSLLFSYFVSLRSDKFKDYIQYKDIFENYEIIPVEISYYFISMIFNSSSLGFLGLLFVYAFLGIGGKLVFAHIFLFRNRLKFVLFVSGYLCSYFILWDLIQIRYSVAVTFLLFGFFINNKNKYLFLLLSVLFHYSMAIPIVIFLIMNLVNNRKIKTFLTFGFVFFAICVINFFNLMSQYSVGENDLSLGVNFFGPFVISKILFLLISLFLVLKYKNYISYSIKKNVTDVCFVALSLFILYIGLSFSHPLAADRFFDVGIFLSSISILFINLKKIDYILILFYIAYMFVFLIAFVFNPYGNSLIFN